MDLMAWSQDGDLMRMCVLLLGGGRRVVPVPVEVKQQCNMNVLPVKIERHRGQGRAVPEARCSFSRQ